MSIQNELYGELLTAKETCELTGFTMNQLRNWRIPARRSLAPIGYVAIGATPYYRLKTVQAYIEKHGTQQGVYYPSELDEQFPIGETVALSAKENLNLATLKAVNTQNVTDWFEKRIQRIGVQASIDWTNAWKRVVEGTDYPTQPIHSRDRLQNLDYWALSVYTARLITNDEQDLGLNLDEIKAIPVGTVPPIKESKF